MRNNTHPFMISSALGIALLILLNYIPLSYLTHFEIMGCVASTAIIVLANSVLSLIVFVILKLFKVTITTYALVLQVVISSVCFSLVHASSYLTWWLPIATSAMCIVLLQSNEWLFYKIKNGTSLKKINEVLLNEFLSDYSTKIDVFYVNNNAVGNELFISQGKTILVIDEPTNTLGQTHTHLAALRLLSIGKTRNVSYGVNFSLLLQFVIFVAAMYSFNFNCILVQPMLNIMVLYYVLNNGLMLLLKKVEQNFELVYDILLYDNTIEKQAFETFIKNSYPLHKTNDKHLHTIYNLEESQLAPYAMPAHVSRFNFGLIQYML
jgi:hypothetical protein